MSAKTIVNFIIPFASARKSISQMSTQTETHLPAQTFFSKDAIEQDKNIPDNTESNFGEVAVKKSGGRLKERKGQSQETYREQRDMFWEYGPLIQNENMLVNYLKGTLGNGNDCNILSMPKIDREKLVHSLERLYFLREYKKCLNDLKIVQISMNIPADIDLNLKKNKGLKNLIQNFDNLRKACESKITTETNDVE